MKKGDSLFSGCPLTFPSTLWRGKVWRVVDGDTLILLVDRGGFDYSTWDCRIQSYNAPERYKGTPEEREQGKRWYEVVRDHAEGKWCMVTTYMDKDLYGRILADVAIYDMSGQVLVDIKVTLRAAGLLEDIHLRISGEST